MGIPFPNVLNEAPGRAQQSTAQPSLNSLHEAAARTERLWEDFRQQATRWAAMHPPRPTTLEQLRSQAEHVAQAPPVDSPESIGCITRRS